jgi:hypothetical protein
MSDTCTRSLELVRGGHIPAIAELAQLDQWVAWKYLTRRGKTDKPPVNPHTGEIASHSNPDHWGSYAQAVSSGRGAAGVGFVFHASDPYTGVDLDGCRDMTTGQIAPWAKRWIDVLDSYTEISPSGTGVKVFVRGTLPATLTHTMGAHIGIEVYSEKRYFTVTHQHLAGTPTAIQGAQAALDLLWATYHQEPKSVAPPTCYKVSPGEAAAGQLSARETIDSANRRHDLGQLLESHGAQLVRTSGDKCYYSGLHGDQHNHDYTYIVSPARDGNGQIGFCYSSGGTLNKGDYPHGFRWFDAFLELDQHGDRIAALKAVSLIPLVANSALARSLPDYLTPAAAAKRQADRERARAARQTRSATRLRQIAVLAEQLAASKACPYDRKLWAYHQRRWEDRVTPEHVDSNERIARSVLGLDRPPTKDELRRLKLAHQRLISRGYLVRTIRYKPGEHNTNCWQPGDGYMVIPSGDETGVRITMVDLESESCLDSGACERGADPPRPDRAPTDPVELLERLSYASYLRNLAELSGQVLDLAELAARPMDGLEQLEAQLLADGAAGEIPQVADSQFENSANAGDVVTGPAGAVAVLGGAAYVPAGAEAWYHAMQIPKALEFDDQVEQLDLAPEPEPEPLVRSAPTEPAAAREYWALKHKKPVNFKQASWIRHRLAALEIWIPVSQALALEPPQAPVERPHQVRRRRAAAVPSVSGTQRVAGEQLALELPIGSSAGEFALSLIERSPPLTSSSGL